MQTNTHGYGKKATEKSRYRLFEKLTTLIEEINQSLLFHGVKLQVNAEYIPEEFREMAAHYAEFFQIDPTAFVMERVIERLLSRDSMNRSLNMQKSWMSM